MNFRRKTSRCLNCGRTLDKIYNYCPHCGQENNDNNVSLGTFIHDFFANYFSFDSKIGKSFLPFFIRPGFLTNRFNEGQRASYVHPLRLYLVVSLVFFFLATLWVKQALDSTSVPLKKNAVQLDANDSLNAAINSTGQFFQIMKDASLSDQQAMDSLRSMDLLEFNADSATFGRKLFEQSRKVLTNDPGVFGAYLVQNLPVMMFVLMPVFALLLKIFYIRAKVLYVQHLIHALHLHAFIFVLFGMLILFYLLLSIPEAWESWLNGTAFLLLSVYTYFSFLRVYRQGWFKTAWKVFLLSNLYFFVLLFFGLTEAFISFLIF